MRVNIDEIKEAGLRRSWDVAREQVDDILQGDKAGYRARGPLHVEAKLEKIDRRVRVDAHGKAELSVPCGRCLQPVSLDQPVDFELTLVPSDEYVDEPRGEKDSSTGPAGGSFEAERADEEIYTGKVVDLDPILREQLLLAVPGYPVCKDDCKGLCPVCGANLNDRECGCDRHVPDPRWAGLKNVKL
ncbi:YceD family protein [Anaeromyxobacter dehalogenans]|uniref:DUF177 domain-containing protein n=1 Tax=Anaeromyxobacter dehalogenans (strain 2CP-C) TaxID=290397 RepID=Q2ILJ0_ANADE|nr:DUF177 domain-containing protein [Anaeromyxobacter dehalogenans]ABC82523.1 protein of unknown function DUF177 [Anaeromyxobacter dehalogenans 2CP-C]